MANKWRPDDAEREECERLDACLAVTTEWTPTEWRNFLHYASDAVQRVTLLECLRSPVSLDRDDVLQEVYFRLLRQEQPTRFENSRHFLAFVRRLAWNLIVDQMRKKRATHSLSDPEEESAAEQVPGREPDPLLGLLSDEEDERFKQALARCLAELEEPKRTAIDRWLAGDPPEAIAGQAGVTRATIYNWYERFREAVLGEVQKAGAQAR